MKSREEIEKKIHSHKLFLKELYGCYSHLSGLEEDNSLTWINALEWVLSD